MMGAMFAALSARDRSNPKRFGNAVFWGLLALSFLFCDALGDFWNGILVIALVVVGGFGLIDKGVARTTTAEERMASAAARGNALFLPDTGLVEAKQVTLISLALGVLIALAGCYVWLKPPPLAPIEEGRRLID